MKSLSHSLILLTATLVLFVTLGTSGDQQGLASTCFQGILKADENKINIADSWRDVTRKSCKPQTTTSAPMTTTRMTTTEPAALETTTIPTAEPEVATTAMIPTDLPLTTHFTTPPVEPVSSTQSGVTYSTMGPNVTTAPPNNTLLHDPVPSGRRKRDAPVLTEGDDNYYCQVFYYRNSSSSDLKFGVNSVLEFSCTEDIPSEECLRSTGTNASINGHNGTLYCCSSDNCNSPSMVVADDKVEVDTVSSCDHYTSEGIQPVPCLQEAHMCLNYTINNRTTYICGNNFLEKEYCWVDGWFGQGCFPKENKTGTACCYLKEEEPIFTTPGTTATVTATPMADDGKKGSQVVTIVIIVLLMFVVGVICGCLLLVLLQKKCRKRQTFGDDMMDFSYSRFKSADSGADEL